jgi:ribose transport system permease protein
MTTQQAPGNRPGTPGNDSAAGVTEHRRPWTAANAATAFRLKGGLVGGIEKYALLGFFIVAMVVFGETATGFFTTDNIQIVLGTQAPLAILAIAAMLPLVVGQFDLSVVAIAGISSIVLATTTSRFHQSLVVAIVAALLAGAVLGLINGLMVARVGVNAFIVTLAMSTVLQGVAQGYTGGSTINSGIPASLLTASTGMLWHIPRGILWLAPVALAMWYLIEQTPYGRHLRALGSNTSGARLVGLRVRTLTASTFVMTGVIAAVGGILLVGQSGDADPETTLGALLLPALAAVFLGASALRPGLFNVAGTVLAVYFVAFIVSGLAFLGASTWVEPVLDGSVLAIAVTITTVVSRKRRTS